MKLLWSLQPPVPQSQPQSRYSEPDSRDWRGRSAQVPSSVEERSWIGDRESGGRLDSRQQDSNQYNRQDQLNSQFGRGQYSSNQGVSCAYYRSVLSTYFIYPYYQIMKQLLWCMVNKKYNFVFSRPNETVTTVIKSKRTWMVP